MNNKKQRRIMMIVLVSCSLIFTIPVMPVSAGSYNGYDLAMAVLENSTTYVNSNYVDTDTSGHRQGAVITSPMGTMQATDGSTFILLSTGIAGSPICTTDAYDPGSERGEYFHGKYDQPRDRSTLTLTLEVPQYMHYLYYDVQFLTAEYPDYIDTQYNDKFTSKVVSPSMGTTQYLIDVNGGDFVLDANDIAGTGFDIFATDGNQYGPGGGVDMVTTTPNSAPDGGATALVTREHPVSPGEQITVTFDIVDTGDNQFDSAAFIDNLCFAGFAKTEIIGRKTATDVNGDELECGDEIKYTITISNTGTADQSDNPGNEFEDFIPENTTYVSGSLAVTSGNAQYLSADQKIIWNGAIPGESSVKIEFNVIVDEGLFSGAVVSNQGSIFWDSDESGNNDATELTDDPAIDDGIDQDSDGVTGDDDPTMMQVYAMEIPEQLTEDFSDDIVGGRATDSFESYQWFETTSVDDTGVFGVVSSYHYLSAKAFKTKTRSATPVQYWNYSVSQFNTGIRSWEVMFTCGNTSEPYSLLLDFNNEDGGILVQLKFEYILVEDDGIRDYFPLLSFKNNEGTWTSLHSAYDGGYLYYDWYKLVITMDENSEYELYQLINKQDTVLDEHIDVGCSTQPLSMLTSITWSSQDSPVVCPLFFFDEHTLGLLPVS